MHSYHTVSQHLPPSSHQPTPNPRNSHPFSETTKHSASLSAHIPLIYLFMHRFDTDLRPAHAGATAKYMRGEKPFKVPKPHCLVPLLKRVLPLFRAFVASSRRFLSIVGRCVSPVLSTIDCTDVLQPPKTGRGTLS